jgi:predicted GTPase
MNRQHGRITRNTLEQRNYDCIIHVLNAQQLGTDEELAHLRWIKNNIQNRPIIFALNKVDIFKSKEDNIDNSIETVRTDLEKLGFENPMICPISAYFAFLIKKKKLGIHLSEEERDEFDLYVKKFNKQVYDLSRFYPQYPVNTSDDESTVLLKKCGFYGFEVMIGR